MAWGERWLCLLAVDIGGIVDHRCVCVHISIYVDIHCCTKVTQKCNTFFHIWSLQKINNIFGCFWIVDTKPIDHSGGIMVSFKCGRSWVPAPVRSNRCSTVRNTALRNKNKDWLSRNRDNVTEWNDLSTLGFYWTRTMKSNSACWSHPNLIL